MGKSLKYRRSKVKGFAERLRQVIAPESVTQFAKRVLAIDNPTTVSNWLDRNTVPRGEYLHAIALETGVSIDWLLGFTEDGDLEGGVPKRRGDRAKAGPVGDELREHLLRKLSAPLELPRRAGVDTRGVEASLSTLVSHGDALLQEVLTRAQADLGQRARAELIASAESVVELTRSYLAGLPRKVTKGLLIDGGPASERLTMPKAYRLDPHEAAKVAELLSAFLHESEGWVARFIAWEPSVHWATDTQFMKAATCSPQVRWIQTALEGLNAPGRTAVLGVAEDCAVPAGALGLVWRDFAGDHCILPSSRNRESEVRHEPHGTLVKLHP